MSKKFTDFLFSFGTMFVGIFLLLLGSMTMGTHSTPLSAYHFPLFSGSALQGSPRVRDQSAGGDLPLSALPSPIHRPTVPLAKNKTSFEQPLTAMAAVVIDDKTNTILFQKNSDQVRSLASITKLMSALVLSDIPIDPATTSVVTEADADPSSHHLNVGEEFTVDDLWQVALIGSSNSAMKMLARLSGLDKTAFVERMNKKAHDLGLTSLHFVEPTGLDSGNVGNVVDTGQLLREALKVDQIAGSLRVGEYYAHPLDQKKARRVWSTNWLLNHWIPSHFSSDHIVGKTGFIVDSGYNFTVRLSDDSGHALRIVIFGASANETRFSEARDLGEWTFEHYLWPDQKGYGLLVE